MYIIMNINNVISAFLPRTSMTNKQTLFYFVFMKNLNDIYFFITNHLASSKQCY